MTRILLSLLLLGALACGGGAPTGRPDIAGVVTAVQRDAAGRVTSVLVEERPGETAGSAKASLRISATTVVRRGDAPASPNDLRQGQRVQAWFSGPVAESYPVQATAAAIQILAEP